MTIEQGPTPRTIVADKIKTDNPNHTVHAYPSVPDNVPANKVIVSVWRTAIEPVQGDENTLTHALEIRVYISATTGEKAESQADDALDTVLLSLQRMDGVSWSKAATETFKESIIGWTINASIQSSNVYKQTVTSE